MGRQEWNREVERDRTVLENILALLLSLAALTDRLSSMPTRDRLHVLAVLGCGEAAARSLLVAMMRERWPEAPAEADVAPYPTGDAALLAACFRVLALALVAMLAETRRLPRHAGSPPRSGPERRWQAIALATPDTS